MLKLILIKYFNAWKCIFIAISNNVSNVCVCTVDVGCREALYTTFYHVHKSSNICFFLNDYYKE